MNERRVLILDDDPAVGMLIDMVVQSTGALSRLTLLPDAFFQAFDSWQPTHVVLDMQMPLMSGQQVMAALVDRHCLARIVVTSGSSEDMAEARRLYETVLDIAGSLPKPFLANSLRALLR